MNLQRLRMKLASRLESLVQVTDGMTFSSAAIGLMELLDGNPVLSGIEKKLVSRAATEEEIEERYSRRTEMPMFADEKQAGWALREIRKVYEEPTYQGSQAGNLVHNLMKGISNRPPHTWADFQRRMLEPVARQLREELDDLESGYSPEHVLAEAIDLVNSGATPLPANVVSAFEAAAAQLARAVTAHDLKGVANTVRTGLEDLAVWCYRDEYLPPGSEPPKGRDFTTKMEYVLRAIRKRDPAEDVLSEELEYVLRKLWRFCCCFVHKTKPSRRETQRLLVYGYLLSQDVADLLQSADLID